MISASGSFYLPGGIHCTQDWCHSPKPEPGSCSSQMCPRSPESPAAHGSNPADRNRQTATQPPSKKPPATVRLQCNTTPMISKQNSLYANLRPFWPNKIASRPWKNQPRYILCTSISWNQELYTISFTSKILDPYKRGHTTLSIKTFYCLHPQWHRAKPYPPRRKVLTQILFFRKISPSRSPFLDAATEPRDQHL